MDLYATTNVGAHWGRVGLADAELAKSGEHAIDGTHDATSLAGAVRAGGSAPFLVRHLSLQARQARVPSRLSPPSVASRRTPEHGEHELCSQWTLAGRERERGYAYCELDLHCKREGECQQATSVSAPPSRQAQPRGLLPATGASTTGRGYAYHELELCRGREGEIHQATRVRTSGVSRGSTCRGCLAGGRKESHAMSRAI